MAAAVTVRSCRDVVEGEGVGYKPWTAGRGQRYQIGLQMAELDAGPWQEAVLSCWIRGEGRVELGHWRRQKTVGIHLFFFFNILSLIAI
jgi:hypothetical protein